MGNVVCDNKRHMFVTVARQVSARPGGLRCVTVRTTVVEKHRTCILKPDFQCVGGWWSEWVRKCVRALAQYDTNNGAYIQ
jgi:hypothetical protein